MTIQARGGCRPLRVQVTRIAAGPERNKQGARVRIARCHRAKPSIIILEMPLDRLRRLGLFLTAILQLLLPGAASIADARLEAVSTRGARVHVESHPGRGCVPAHAGDCAICRVVSAFADTPDASPPTPLPRVRRADLPDLPGVAPVATALGDPSQRAPPSA